MSWREHHIVDTAAADAHGGPDGTFRRRIVVHVVADDADAFGLRLDGSGFEAERVGDWILPERALVHDDVVAGDGISLSGDRHVALVILKAEIPLQVVDHAEALVYAAHPEIRRWASLGEIDAFELKFAFACGHGQVRRVAASCARMARGRIVFHHIVAQGHFQPEVIDAQDALGNKPDACLAEAVEVVFLGYGHGRLVIGGLGLIDHLVLFAGNQFALCVAERLAVQQEAHRRRQNVLPLGAKEFLGVYLVPKFASDAVACHQCVDFLAALLDLEWLEWRDDHAVAANGVALPGEFCDLKCAGLNIVVAFFVRGGHRHKILSHRQVGEVCFLLKVRDRAAKVRMPEALQHLSLLVLDLDHGLHAGERIGEYARHFQLVAVGGVECGAYVWKSLGLLVDDLPGLAQVPVHSAAVIERACLLVLEMGIYLACAYELCHQIQVHNARLAWLQGKLPWLQGDLSGVANMLHVDHVQRGRAVKCVHLRAGFDFNWLVGDVLYPVGPGVVVAGPVGGMAETVKADDWRGTVWNECAQFILFCRAMPATCFRHAGPVALHLEAPGLAVLNGGDAECLDGNGHFHGPAFAEIAG